MFLELKLAAKDLQITALLDLLTSNTMCLLVTNDNELFSAKRFIIEQSNVIKNMLEDCSDNPEQPIPLPNISSSVLKMVLEYCSHRHDFPDTGPRPHRLAEIGEWDRKFLTVDDEMLFEIIMAANYLDIKPLLDVSCKTITNKIKNSTPEEIRRLFNVDFTPQETFENQWLEDRTCK